MTDTATRTRVIHVNDMPKYPDAIYIGRANHWKRLKASPWANPYRIGPNGSRTDVVQKYFELLDVQYMTAADNSLHEALKRLVGHPLACWCRRDGDEPTEDNACHGDAIIEYLRYLGLEEIEP